MTSALPDNRINASLVVDGFAAPDQRTPAPPAVYARLLQLVRRIARFALLGWQQPPTVRRVVWDQLSYSSGQTLIELHDTVRRIEADGLKGVMIEAGCALGGSALVIAAAKAPGRAFLIYDVFGMPPGPSAGDGPEVHERWAEIAGGRSAGIGGETYYGYRDNLLSRVIATFKRYRLDPPTRNVHFVQGLLQDTMTGADPVAFAHIDCDRYESVRHCLANLAPRMVPGGVMVIDDYAFKSGCRKAIDDFLAEGDAFTPVWKSRLHLVRCKAVSMGKRRG